MMTPEEIAEGQMIAAAALDEAKQGAVFTYEIEGAVLLFPKALASLTEAYKKIDALRDCLCAQCSCDRYGWKSDCPTHGVNTSYYASIQHPNYAFIQHPMEPPQAPRYDYSRCKSEQVYITQLGAINDNLGEIENTISKGNQLSERISNNIATLNQNLETLIRVQDRK